MATGGDDDDDSSDDGRKPHLVTKSSSELAYLTWRMSPEESLSDWTIDIIYTHVGDDGAEISKTDVYHVHTCFLAAGLRKSGYFVNLFSDGGRFAESQEQKSRIELHELAAKAFPDLLDYLYQPLSPPNIKTENATALHFLSKYLVMPHLSQSANDFWKKDITRCDTCGTYYEHAFLLHHRKILKAARDACFSNICRITTTSRLVHAADMEFGINLVSRTIRSNRNTSRHLSTLVAAMCLNCPVDQDTFQRLTHASVLPHIHEEAALSMLEAERQIMSPDETALTPLQERCIKAFTAHRWSSALLKETGARDIFHKQGPLVLSELLSLRLENVAVRHGY